jgi:hypothetical protein
MAQKYLARNKINRPISWNKVDQYRETMERGEWKLHSQGIIFDNEGDLLTGQKRLLAIIYAGIPQYLRVSRGSPTDTARLIDRGTPQSSRDIASRHTERKHSPTEASICRAIYAIEGKLKPNVDEIADKMVEYDAFLALAMKQTRGIRKIKPVLMIMAALGHLSKKDSGYNLMLGLTEKLAEELTQELAPIDPKACWNKGAAFILAMEKTVAICEAYKKLPD